MMKLQSSGKKSENAWLIKKTLISDMDSDSQIYLCILEYIRLLNDQVPEITEKFMQICDNEVMVRVKAQNSIEYKIQNYKTAKHEFGKVPINKCINDLFGVRFIWRDSLDYKSINTFVTEKYQEKYKCIDSTKGDYKAVHIYFRRNNYSFPWELQIWNECDKKANFLSHKTYKQEYTLWEKESRKGGISRD